MVQQAVDLSVVIVSADGGQMLQRCLESVYAAGDGIALEVICVDDASEDGTPERIREKFPEVQLIRNQLKQTYPITNNQGVRQARGHYVAIVNDDVIVAPDAWRQLVEFLDGHPQAGAASPRLHNDDGTVQPCVRRFPDLGAALAQSVDLHRVWPANPWTRRYYADDFDYDQTQRAPSIGTTCYVMRRECWEDVGGLDERFPINFCDHDLNWRINEAGWQVWLVAEAEALHYGGQTMGRLSLRQLWDMHRGMWLMYRKHYCPRRNLIINGLVTLGIGLRFVYKCALRILALDRLLCRLPSAHRRRCSGHDV